ncbi:MAG: hypothetical protein Q4B69_05085 [Slackia sp.]|nr:hypothetical protein [Slackia sp.]
MSTRAAASAAAASMPNGSDSAAAHAAVPACNRTRNLCIACALALIAVLLIMQTISFVVRSTDARNTVVFGGVGVELVETALDASNTEVIVPDGADENIAESGSCSRIVRVRNTQNHPVFVRVSLSMTGADSNGADVPADDLVSYTFADPAWKNGGDGWYYYDAVLDPGVTTPPLITGISFNVQGIHDRYQGGALELSIDAAAVQSENNAQSALDAEGWPQEKGR